MTDTRETLEAPIARVRKVGEGRTINGIYRQSPIAALDAFRLDLLTICAAALAAHREVGK